ncbi:MAG: phosphoribosylglycinamide formyltransferase [Thermoguttaceae bacterium]
MTKKLQLAVLISGTGRSLKNLIDLSASGELPAEVAVVIASTPTASGLQYAEIERIPIEVVERRNYATLIDFSTDIFAICRKMEVDYVILAGYIKFLAIPKDFENRVINIHPSLIPAFCGKGHYGNIVHAKVIEFGAKISGCTVHFVDENYDSGPIILQRAVEVKDDDTPDTLNARVFEAERIAYPDAIRLLAEKRVSVQGRIVKIAPSKTEDRTSKKEIDF